MMQNPHRHRCGVCWRRRKAWPWVRQAVAGRGWWQWRAGRRNKVRPTACLLDLTREKLRPARHKTPILGHFEHAGRTFSRSHPPPDHAGRTFSRTGRSEVVTVKPTTPLQPLIQASVKPPSPMLAPEQHPLKPATPMQPKSAPKAPNSHPQRRWRFQAHAGTHEHRRPRFQTSGQSGLQDPDAVPVGGGGARTGAKTMHRTRQQRPSPTGVEGAGGTGGHGRATHKQRAPTDWRLPRGLRGLAGLRGDAPSEARGADGERAGRPRGGRKSVEAPSNAKPPGSIGTGRHTRQATAVRNRRSANTPRRAVAAVRDGDTGGGQAVA